MPVPSVFWNFHDHVQNVTDSNCSHGVLWIWISLHDCVYDTRGIASVILGLVSIVSWMIVGIPQMVMNCRNIRGIAGVSFFLLAQWTLGDATNLVGSILTKQLPLQTYLAVYFVFADIVLLAQFTYYKFWRRKQKRESAANNQDSSRGILCITGVFLSVWGIQKTFGPFMQFNISDSSNFPVMHHPAGRNILAANLKHRSVFTNTTDEVGYAIGILSSIFYIGSRSAQLWKNYKRKSTVGLSLLMFLLAIIGNLTYGLAILVRELDSNYIIRHIPWLVGSLGVIALDVSLLVQFKYYSQTDFDHLLRAPLMETEYPSPDEVTVNGPTD